MSPIYAIQLPFFTILQQLAEIAEFLADKGLVDGWDQLPMNVLGTTTTWNELLRVGSSPPVDYFQYMNILMPWNQDSSLNKQLVKLFSFSPYCVTLDHPSFRFAFFPPGTESILVGGEIRNNSDGCLFLKLFKQSEKITTLVLLQYPFACLFWLNERDPSPHYLYVHSHSLRSAQTQLDQRCAAFLFDPACWRYLLFVPSICQLDVVAFFAAPHLVLLFAENESDVASIDSFHQIRVQGNRHKHAGALFLLPAIEVLPQSQRVDPQYSFVCFCLA